MNSKHNPAVTIVDLWKTALNDLFNSCLSPLEMNMASCGAVALTQLMPTVDIDENIAKARPIFPASAAPHLENIIGVKRLNIK
jgi:hypothetical protein